MPDWLLELVKVVAALSAVLLPAIGALYLYRSSEQKAGSQNSAMQGIGTMLADKNSLLMIGEGLGNSARHLEQIAGQLKADGDKSGVEVLLARIAVPLETIAELLVKQDEEQQQQERDRLREENAELRRQAAMRRDT